MTGGSSGGSACAVDDGTRIEPLVSEPSASGTSRPATAATEAALARIAGLNPLLNAFTDVTAARARTQAEALDARRAAGETLGPLAGVPFAVKNMFDVADLPTRAGSKINRELPPAQRDSPLVERLEGGEKSCAGKPSEPHPLFTATPREYSPAGSWSGRPTIRSRSASSRRTTIPTTTRSRRFGGAFSRRSRVCSCRCWSWRARWACSRWVRSRWTAPRIHANASRHSAHSYEHAGKRPIGRLRR
jgi:hypothetical protein